MSRSIIKNLPSGADLIKMDSSELAGYLLEHIHTLSTNQLNQASPHNVALWIAPLYASHRDEVGQAIYRACEWLVRNDYLEKKNDQGFFIISRRGKSIKTASDFRAHSFHAPASPANTDPSEPTSENYDDGAVFPEHLIDKMVIGCLHIIEVDDVATERDLQRLIKYLYDYPERSFYYFEEKDGRQNQLIRAAHHQGEILIEEYEKHYYRHPNFKRDYVKLYSADGNYPFDWEREVVESGPMFIRFTLRLSERKRRELEIAQRIETERNVASPNKPESADSITQANQLYDKVKVLSAGRPLDQANARFIVEACDDAIKEFGSTNQEKKVELRQWKARAELVLPPSTIEELRKRAEGELLKRSYPKNVMLRTALLVLVVVVVVTLGFFALKQAFLTRSNSANESDSANATSSPTFTPTQSDVPTSTVIPTAKSSLTPSASSQSRTDVSSEERRPTEPTGDPPPSSKQNRDKEEFNQLLKDARKLLEVEQHNQACQLYRQAVGILPDSKKGDVSFGSIAEGNASYDREEFRTAAKKYAEAFQKVSIQ